MQHLPARARLAEFQIELFPRNHATVHCFRQRFVVRFCVQKLLWLLLGSTMDNAGVKASLPHPK
jgi:hypothetical protein